MHAALEVRPKEKQMVGLRKGKERTEGEKERKE